MCVLFVAPHGRQTSAAHTENDVIIQNGLHEAEMFVNTSVLVTGFICVMQESCSLLLQISSCSWMFSSICDLITKDFPFLANVINSDLHFLLVAVNITVTEGIGPVA